MAKIFGFGNVMLNALHCKIYSLSYIIYFTFRGSVQDYKIHMDMEIVMFA